jgi:hypothetical protein
MDGDFCFEQLLLKSSFPRAKQNSCNNANEFLIKYMVDYIFALFV